jgi:hypothetical protein
MDRMAERAEDAVATGAAGRVAEDAAHAAAAGNAAAVDTATTAASELHNTLTGERGACCVLCVLSGSAPNTAHV